MGQPTARAPCRQALLLLLTHCQRGWRQLWLQEPCHVELRLLLRLQGLAGLLLLLQQLKLLLQNKRALHAPCRQPWRHVPSTCKGDDHLTSAR